MRHASLFSGIGGFDLAASWVGWDNLFHCEIDSFCQKILKYHFSSSISYGDIKSTDFTAWKGRIDVFRQDSHASPSHRPENEREPAMTATCGPKLFEWLKKSGPVGSWARTFTELLIGQKGWFSNRCL